jgi:predicted secreted protein
LIHAKKQQGEEKTTTTTFNTVNDTLNCIGSDSCLFCIISRTFFCSKCMGFTYVSSVSVSPSSTEKTKGETATYTVTVSRSSGSGSGTINLSFQSSTIPSSAATFESTSVNFGNGGSNSKSVSLTINTNDLSIDQHTFTVKGTKSNAASDSATSASTTLIVTEPPNQPPTADAGTDQTVAEGSTVNLDGSSSSDPDGDSLSYSWEQTAGEAVTLDGADTATPSFTAPSVSSSGATLTFQLTVDDGNDGTDIDSVDIVVENSNQPPTADAGSDASANEGDLVTLDGSASSDPDGTVASYSWTQTAGTSVTLSDANSATPSFTAPDVGPDGEIL